MKRIDGRRFEIGMWRDDRINRREDRETGREGGRTRSIHLINGSSTRFPSAAGINPCLVDNRRPGAGDLVHIAWEVVAVE